MKLHLFDSDITSKYIIESALNDEGSFKSLNWISFENEDNYIITFEYDIEVEGYLEEDEGDYWTPPYSETVITNFDITIKRCYYMDINDNEISLEITDDCLKKLTSLIEKYY